MEYLNLSGNELTYIPDSIYSLPTLKKLDLSEYIGLKDMLLKMLGGEKRITRKNNLTIIPKDMLHSLPGGSFQNQTNASLRNY